MEMAVQVKSETGEDINGAEVYINGALVGKTPNVVVEVSSAVWKHYYIKVKCDGYNEIEIEATKEPKFGMIIVGFFLLWWLWLWGYGPKSFQKITLLKKKEVGSALGNKEKFIQFIGKNWKDVLLENNLGEYIDVFEKNRLTDLEIISELTELDLEKLGIAVMGDRKKILKIYSVNEISTASIEDEKKTNVPLQNKTIKIKRPVNVVGSVLMVDIKIDNITTFKLSNGEDMVFPVENGKHTILASLDNDYDKIEFEITDNEKEFDIIIRPHIKIIEIL
jgi:hypothetical protein